MKKSIKNCISSILTLLSVLSLVSCDGGGDGDSNQLSRVGGGDGSTDSTDAVALSTLFAGEDIEYYELGTTNVRDSVEFASDNISGTTNVFGKVYSYNSDLGGDKNFQLKGASSEGNKSQKVKLEEIVFRLIQGPDSNADFVSMIREGGLEYNAVLMEGYINDINGGGLVVEARGGELFALNGPVYYDHTIDSSLDAQFIAGVIEGIYNLYTVERKITFRNASDPERDVLETVGTNFTYSIPQVEDESDNLTNLLTDGSATLSIEGARFKIFLQADNTGR
jgi:hypothetical protein